MRRVALAAGASAVVLLSASPAFASWSASGAGAAAASGGSLIKPNLNATTGQTSSAATINWSAPGNGQNGSTYTATATSSGHSTKTCNALASATSCSLSGLDATTTYNVSVTASLGSNWTSSSATTTAITTAAATGIAGIRFTNMSPSPTCDFSTPSDVTCTVGVPKNSGFTGANVQLVDANQNPINNSTGSARTVTLTTSGGGTVTPTSLSIANGASTTGSTFRYDIPNGSGGSGSVTASVTVAGTTYTAQVVATSTS